MLVQRLRAVLMGLALVFVCSVVEAGTTATFNGAADALFSNGANWIGGEGAGGIPGVGQHLQITATCNVDAATSNLQYSNLQIDMPGTLTWTSTVTLDVVAIAGVSGNLALVNGTLKVRGTFDASGITFSGSSGTVEYAGGALQTAPGLPYGNLIINNATGVSMGGTSTVALALTIGSVTSNSVLKDNGFQISSTGSLIVQNASKFSLGAGSATNFPNFGVVTLNAGTAIEYGSSAPQTVKPRTDYRSLKLTGAGTKTVALGNLTVLETFFVDSACTLGSSVYNVNDVSGTGVITLAASDLNVGGNWINTGGTTVGGAGEVTFTGTSPSITGCPFERIHFQNIGTANVTGTLTVNTFGTIQGGSTVQVQDIAGSGLWAPSSGSTLRVFGAYSLTNTTLSIGVRVDYNGSGAQTVALDDYGDLEISQARGTNMVTFAVGTIGIQGAFFNNASFTGGGGYDLLSNTINYKGAGPQMVANFKYYNLTVSNARTTNNVTFSNMGPIGVEANFTLSLTFSSGQCITTGSSIDFFGSGQSINAPPGSANFNYDSITVSGIATTSGNFGINRNLDITGTGQLDLGSSNLAIGGNINKMGNLSQNTSSVTLNGVAPQMISGNSEVSFNNLILNNASGIALGANIRILSLMTFTAGKIFTGPNRVLLNSGTTVGSSDANHIVGTCRRAVEAPGQNFIFPVGDGVRLVPVQMLNVGPIGSGTLDVSVFNADHPDIFNSGIDANKSVNRVYKITYSSLANGFDMILPFDPLDFDPGLNTANLVSRLFNGTTWSPPNPGAVTATSVTIANIDAATSGEYQLGELFTAPPPTIKSIAATQNAVKAGVSITFTADTDGTKFLWDFGDGSPQESTNPVTHTFNIEGTFTVNLEVSNQAGAATAKLTVKVFAPASGGTGVKNASDGDAAIVNPLNGLSVKVMNSEGGVIELSINVDALNRAAFDVSTDFDGVGGRQSTATGTKPVTKVEKAGIVVATISATDAGTTTLRGKARKTIVVGRKETGEKPLSTAAPASSDINLASMKGKFLFNKDTPDSVSFVGTIELPAGMDLSQPQEFSMGMGNVIDTVMVDPKGKTSDKGTLERITKLNIKYPKLPKDETLTTTGQKAKITITMSTANMDSIGFDTEGITAALRNDEAGEKSVPRSIQVAMVLAGVSYEGTAPVEYKVSKKGDAGTMGGRGSAK